MPLSWNEIRQRAITFSRNWASASSERAEAQTFWNEFFEVFGKSRRAVASFEESVKSLSGTPHRIDVFWPGRLIGEHKSRGEDLTKAHTQAIGYVTDLISNGREDEAPRYIITTDFARLVVHDLEPDQPTDLYDFSADSSVAFDLKDLHKHIRRFAFIAGYETRSLDPENPANFKAVELLANVHDRLEEAGYQGHDLQRFMVRILFCLFAEDTGIFEPAAFTDLLVNYTRRDGTDLGAMLAQLFSVLNTPQERRQKNLADHYAQLPYVNGALFAESLSFASFNSAMREALLVCCNFRWETISPAIFGSLFQSIMQPPQRRQIGAHYTSERDILKLIRSLFLDRLETRLNRCTTKPDYDRFLKHLGSLKFLDPACGCGNFLVIAYRQLRRLEMTAIEKRFGHEPSEGDIRGAAQMNVEQFYGIELEEWPALIAEVAMWLMDHQMNNELFARFGSATPTVPLKRSPTICCANALKLDWNEVLPAGQCSYIMGNPPFVGKKEQTRQQKDELHDAWKPLKKVSSLDYVSAWYILATKYTAPSPAPIAFVSTNSISQGEQVGVMWPMLFNLGIKIDFGHRTFPWTSEARGKAHVHVVIIGFSHDGINKPPRIYEYTPKSELIGITEASNISPYLADGQDLTVSMRSRPLCPAPVMQYGSMMIDKDCGQGYEYGLILDKTWYDKIICECPELKPYIRIIYGGLEYIRGEKRWCLWLEKAPPQLLRTCPELKRRLAAIRKFRSKSSRQRTRQLARTPQLFGEIRQPDRRYLLVPKVSSERRDYIPIGFVEPEIVASGSALIISEADFFTFGILSSAMHNTWMRHVAGRLESRYQYSASLVYNNYPWPAQENAIPARRRAVEKAAQGVLDARAKYLPPKGQAILADLYDPLTMPADLARAHAALDRAVDRCYRSQAFPDERRRFEYLFGLYESLVAPLTAPKQKTRRRK